MSNASIIAMKSKQGGYIAAWNWFDGVQVNLEATLKECFTNENDTRELINFGAFGNIYTLKTKKLYDNVSRLGYVKEQMFILKFLAGGKGFYISTDNGNVPNQPYSYWSIKEMLKEDIACLYLFEDGNWKTIRKENSSNA